MLLLAQTSWLVACAADGDSAWSDATRAGSDSAWGETDSADPTVDTEPPDSGDSGTCTHLTWYRDADGDGHGDPAVATDACIAPDGFVADALDCDDSHAQAYADAAEAPADGVDNDCDGVWSRASVADMPIWQAIGARRYAELGISIAVGDYNGDGIMDLALGGESGELGGEARMGSVLVFDGPLYSTTSAVDETSASASMYGGTLDMWSDVCSVGDIDSDGFADMVIGAPDAGGNQAGVAYVARGPIGGTMDLTVDASMFVGSVAGEAFGGCAGPGDVDGDGVPDVILAASETAGGGDERGSVYLLRGPADLTSVEDADQILAGTEDEEHLGASVAGLGDLNGDGMQDYAVTNAQLPGAVSDGVSTYIVMDYAPGTYHPRDVGVTVHYDLSGPTVKNMVASPAGDLNGDGNDDVAFGVGMYQGNDSLTIIEGPFGAKSSVSLLEEGSIVFDAAADGSNHWLSFAAALGDWNGDGLGGLAIADPGSATADALAHHDCFSSNGCDQGAIYLLALPIDPGAYDLATTGDRIEGVLPNGYMGGGAHGPAIAGGADLNDDGLPDLAFAAWYASSSTQSAAGSAYILFAGGKP